MTFVITHGYLEHGKKNWLQEMKDELLKNGDHNVLIVVRKWIDWTRIGFAQKQLKQDYVEYSKFERNMSCFFLD